jgi:hypothetical protein
MKRLVGPLHSGVKSPMPIHVKLMLGPGFEMWALYFDPGGALRYK